MTSQERTNLIINLESFILRWQTEQVPVSCVQLRDAAVEQAQALLDSARRNEAAGLTGAEWNAARARLDSLAGQFDACWNTNGRGGIPMWLKVGGAVGVGALVIWLIARR